MVKIDNVHLSRKARAFLFFISWSGRFPVRFHMTTPDDVYVVWRNPLPSRQMVAVKSKRAIHPSYNQIQSLRLLLSKYPSRAILQLLPVGLRVFHKLKTMRRLTKPILNLCVAECAAHTLNVVLLHLNKRESLSVSTKNVVPWGIVKTTCNSILCYQLNL